MERVRDVCMLMTSKFKQFVIQEIEGKTSNYQLHSQQNHERNQVGEQTIFATFFFQFEQS